MLVQCDVVFVELPEPGTKFDSGQAFGVIESVKAVSDLSIPIGGEIVEINPALEDTPEIVNEDCYGAGWLIVIRPNGDDDRLLCCLYHYSGSAG